MQRKRRRRIVKKTLMIFGGNYKKKDGCIKGGGLFSWYYIQPERDVQNGMIDVGYFTLERAVQEFINSDKTNSVNTNDTFEISSPEETGTVSQKMSC